MKGEVLIIILVGHFVVVVLILRGFEHLDLVTVNVYVFVSSFFFLRCFGINCKHLAFHFSGYFRQSLQKTKKAIATLSHLVGLIVIPWNSLVIDTSLVSLTFSKMPFFF